MAIADIFLWPLVFLIIHIKGNIYDIADYILMTTLILKLIGIVLGTFLGCKYNMS